MAVTGVLALQGAFREHIAMLASLGARCRELRQAKDLDGISALVLPGGESTTIGKLLTELDMLARIKADIQAGMPVFGTCAGLILLARDIVDSRQPRLGLLDVRAARNAFGRQVNSFETDLDVQGIGGGPFPAVFIRAPLIESAGPEVEILASVEDKGRTRPVAVRQKNILAASFHPELTDDTRMHRYFLGMTGA